MAMSPSLNAGVPRTTRFAAAFAVVVFSLVLVAHSSNNINDSEVICSRTCVAENCNSVGIRYGKYCGVGWTGCPGEKPCDDLDACCKIHDDCVGKKGLTDIKCHEKFKTCIKNVQKSGKAGFSKQCPYETAVPTMVSGEIETEEYDLEKISTAMLIRVLEREYPVSSSCTSKTTVLSEPSSLRTASQRWGFPYKHTYERRPNRSAPKD